jgi:hypothetical protein
MLNSRIGDFNNNNDVINSNDLRKRIINVDSRFRTNCEDPATDFTYQPEHTYKNIIRLRVASVEIPNMWYTFSKAKHNISFIVKAYDITSIPRQALIEIEEGNYTHIELVNLIQEEFNKKLRDPWGIFMIIDVNLNTAKVTLTNAGVSSYPVVVANPVPTQSAKPFVLDFLTEVCNRGRLHNFGLGYHLGYRKRCFKVQTTEPSPIIPTLTAYYATAEGCVDVIGDAYIFLAINDLHTVEQKTNDDYLQVLAKIIIRDDKQSLIFDDGSTLLSNEIIFPSPVDIKTLNVQLLDPYGEIIELCGMNFSFSLEITEVTNTRMYDFYRNYIWLGSIPSVDYKKVTGTQQGLLRGIGPPF